jgi:hypothetical protein
MARDTSWWSETHPGHQHPSNQFGPGKGPTLPPSAQAAVNELERKEREDRERANSPKARHARDVITYNILKDIGAID